MEDENNQFESQRDLFALIGLTLVELQGVEKLLKACYVFVLRDANGNPLEDLRDRTKRNRTLGQFLNALRQKSSIDPTFDEVLSNFLEHRNRFVHDLLSQKHAPLETKLGRYHLEVFVNLLRTEMDTVSKALMGFLMVWMEPEKYADLTKVRVAFPEGSWLGDAEQIFAPHVAKLVQPRRKPSN
ncbi:MAG: hypothetical protein H0W34_11520 [Pyrinomonadaceae bacterium]|nr:hypothetical protein [Chthoniobacterales bacterium]MBA3572573.1 hypothetical protein [Pyrinomonadaceae bacterium]